MTIFAVWVGLGAALGLLWTAWQTPAASPHRLQISLDARLNGGLFTLLGAVLGARAQFAAENWLAFRVAPGETLALWQGGLSAGGALLGGLAGLGLYALARRLPLGSLADSLLPLAAALAVTLPLAAWAAGSAYGEPSTAAWAIPTADEWGALAGRVPLQALAAGLGLVGFLALETARPHLTHAGAAAALGLGLLSALLLGVSLLRADPSPLLSGQRPDTWAAATGLALSLLAGLASAWAKPRAAASANDSI